MTEKKLNRAARRAAEKAEKKPSKKQIFAEYGLELKDGKYIYHPVLGWIELGGAGIFRPEVTKPMNVDVPVLAWGIGIDRMALMSLGLNDLRELFQHQAITLYQHNAISHVRPSFLL